MHLPDLEDSGPLDYVVVEFPPGGLRGDAFPLLMDLNERGVIRVLDLVVVGRSADGSFGVVAFDELRADGLDARIFAGIPSEILDDHDLREVARGVAPGYSAAVLVYENSWAAPLARTLRRNGAQLLESRRVPVQALLAKLDVLADRR